MSSVCLWCHPSDGFDCAACGAVNLSGQVFNIHDAPPGAVYIGRGTDWGNPWPISERWGDREMVIQRYWQYARKRLLRQPEWLEPLRGRALKCHCAPLACHGDVLLYYLRRTVTTTGDGAGVHVLGVRSGGT